MIATRKQVPKLVIVGGSKLSGEVHLSGAKNEALPAVAAALFAEKGTTVIHNFPNLVDTRIMLDIARALGAEVTHDLKSKIVTINAENIDQTTIPADLGSQIRTGILFVPALTIRLGEVTQPPAGGCATIGNRPTDYHYRGFARMGADVVVDETGVVVHANKLHGAKLYQDIPSHTGTINLAMFACRVSGTTVIENAATEPEVVNILNMLVRMGAKIAGIGTQTLFIRGVKKLNAVEHTISPDRHEFTAFASAVAITRGKAELHNVIPAQQRITEHKLLQMGIGLKHVDGTTQITGPEKPKPINVRTWVHPGYPTDGQPSITALATLAGGTSYILDSIYPERTKHVDWLVKMRADIIINRKGVIVVNGVDRLHGAITTATDIRAGMALVIAALAADGTTTIYNANQIFRGHGEDVVTRLSQLGANISIA